jgi:hypothetical protein
MSVDNSSILHAFESLERGIIFILSLGVEHKTSKHASTKQFSSATFLVAIAFQLPAWSNLSFGPKLCVLLAVRNFVLLW